MKGREVKGRKVKGREMKGRKVKGRELKGGSEGREVSAFVRRAASPLNTPSIYSHSLACLPFTLHCH